MIFDILLEYLQFSHRQEIVISILYSPGALRYRNSQPCYVCFWNFFIVSNRFLLRMLLHVWNLRIKFLSGDENYWKCGFQNELISGSILLEYWILSSPDWCFYLLCATKLRSSPNCILFVRKHLQANSFRYRSSHHCIKYFWSYIIG